MSLPAPNGSVGQPEPEQEPEGLAEAVPAAVFMLLLSVGVAFVGSRWERAKDRAAHDIAVDLVQRVAAHGDKAIVPTWSGWGRGPATRTAHQTFDALHNLGPLVSTKIGTCAIASRFALCTGTRFHCEVSGSTPAGPVEASIGLCDAGGGLPYTFDSFDLTVPAVGADLGNRSQVDVSRDGLIRYGVIPLPPEMPPQRMHQRAPLGPLRW